MNLGEGRGEIDESVPLGAVEHPGNRIDLAGFKRPADIAPGPYPYLDVDSHLPGYRPGQIDVQSGRLSLIVDKGVGRKIKFGTDYQGPGGIGKEARRGPEYDEKKECTDEHERKETLELSFPLPYLFHIC